MRYIQFQIENYRGITSPLKIDIDSNSLIPLVGINECGKTTILQALYCFDYINDKENKGKHLADMLNLYKTADKNPPIIKASIEIKKSELENIIEVFNDKEVAKKSELTKAGTPNTPTPIDITSIPKAQKNISIQRNLVTKEYTFSNDDFSILNPIAQSIIGKTPYILYNDDFMDRPPNEVKIPPTKPETLTDWLAIYEKLFNSTDDNYSLFEVINEDDKRRRDSIISDVEDALNKKLSKAWKTFLLSAHGALTVKLTLDVPTRVLRVEIVEKIGTKNRHFKIADRSKGFLWFFNFVMKLEFNPKVIGNIRDTIFLLDEPGSYLHSTAQEKLCHKIKEISEKSGNVIYCTHSHHLLNPDYIPLNKIYIIQKEKHKNIKATPLPMVKLDKQNVNAYQPILDALQIPAFDLFNNSQSIIAVEGIYDKYSIMLFCDLDDEVIILPGTSADSILKNIQFLNGFSKHYIAIWDNDEEGNIKYKQARKTFGENESEKCDLLPLIGKTKRKMEDMYANDDLEKMKEVLNLPSDADYEKTISTLFFSNKTKRNKVKKVISDETKNSFEVLSKVIRKRFKLAIDIDKYNEM